MRCRVLVVRANTMPNITIQAKATKKDDREIARFPSVLIHLYM